MRWPRPNGLRPLVPRPGADGAGVRPPPTARLQSSPKLPGLVRQHVIRDSDGQFIGRVDLAVPWVRLAIEAHSREFHTGPDAELVDERRESLATLEGWEFEYVGRYHATRTPAQVREYLERLVERRARDLRLEAPGG